jgi:uncharacterized protein with HEPN domain
MKKRPAGIFLDDILRSIKKIEEYIDGLNYKRFCSDEKSVDAVIRNLEIIGEASKNIPFGVKDKFTQIPWKRMTGLRNLAIHEYFGVDLKIIWEVATKNLPEVKPMIEQILKEKAVTYDK